MGLRDDVLSCALGAPTLVQAEREFLDRVRGGSISPVTFSSNPDIGRGTPPPPTSAASVVVSSAELTTTGEPPSTSDPGSGRFLSRPSRRDGPRRGRPAANESGDESGDDADTEDGDVVKDAVDDDVGDREPPSHSRSASFERRLELVGKAHWVCAAVASGEDDDDDEEVRHRSQDGRRLVILPAASRSSPAAVVGSGFMLPFIQGAD